jgi:hypothetical protein
VAASAEGRCEIIGLGIEASIIRLIGAVLVEQNDEWLLQHCYMQIEGNGRTYTAADRHRPGETSTHGGLTNGYLKLHPDLHQLDGRDLKWRITDAISNQRLFSVRIGRALPVSDSLVIQVASKDKSIFVSPALAPKDMIDHYFARCSAWPE